MLTERWALALHGGAGVKAGRSYPRAEACLARLVIEGAARLSAGDGALDVVEDLTAAMENSGLFVAGRGAAPNRLGQVELDASIMCGRQGRAGAVAAMQGVAAPIRVARLLMEHSPHVLLAGEGAAAFALDQGCAPIGDPTLWLTTPDGFQVDDLEDGHGTVGAVALDGDGHLAAATSTGGTYGALPGRVGDSAVIGAGTWADGDVAVSCTGEGEAFILAAAASDLAARVRYGGQSLPDAALSVLETVRGHGGDGGLIAVSRAGDIVAPFDTDGMKRATAAWNQPALVGVIGQVMQDADNVFRAFQTR
jgi:isoaspartyl peptidase/L-asparaginase-like protein (Ntn-hydrolase superfamily)